MISRKSILLLLILLSNPSIIFFQPNTSSINGTVLDAKTGEPIPSVNVFISGSLWGTTTDSNGDFNIKHLPQGNHQLIASMVGYEMEMKVITLQKEQEVIIEFFLKEKTYELKEIEVAAEIPDEWFDNLEVFKKYFLGQSEFAKECTIENEFYIDLKENYDTLFANCERPLIIINNALGYRIECYLLGFQYNSQSGICTYFTNTKFSELAPEDEDQKEDWNENRKIAYLGSLKHFLISLIQNDFSKNGFSIYHIYPTYQYRIEISNSVLEVDSSNKEYHLKFDYSLSIGFFHSIRRRLEYSSIICLVDSVTLDEFGDPKEILPFRIQGFWATRGVADLLPKDFIE